MHGHRNLKYRVYEENKCYEIWYLEYVLECQYSYGLKSKSLNYKCYVGTEQVTAFSCLGNSISYEKTSVH